MGQGIALLLAIFIPILSIFIVSFTFDFIKIEDKFKKGIGWYDLSFITGFSLIGTCIIVFIFVVILLYKLLTTI